MKPLSASRKPLAGLRVIDLTQAMAAPFCTMNLADLGADVIKIEPPGEGEPTRQLGAAQKNGHSATFMTMNRGKRGLAVDLKQPEGVEILRRLAKTADVFVQNYRPGVVQRLGLDFDSLKELNPRLIYCAISGFGATGPYAPRGGYDLIAQGMSGVMSLTGDEGGPPAKSGIPLSDLAAGLFGAYGILCALEHRERTGQGQLVDTSLLEAAMALTALEASDYWATGRVPGPMGSADRAEAPHQALRAKDGYFTVAAGDDERFAALCAAIGRAALSGDERFASPAARQENRGALIAQLEETTGTQARSVWLGRLEKAGVPCGPVNDYAEALADPQTLARDMVVELRHPGAGDIKALGVPVKLSDTPAAVGAAAPLLGEHTAEILEELCYSESEQRALLSKGVIQFR
jgi:formyl-CoA transferase